MMMELFNAYKVDIKKKPIKVTDWVGGMARKVTRSKERPLTLEGFENYCFEKGIINDLGDYFENRNEAYADFSAICSRIKKIIRQDQIEGGMAGNYNPSITQRLNGLVDKVQSDVKIESYDVSLKL